MDFVAIVACVILLAGSFAVMATRRKPMWRIEVLEIKEYSFVPLPSYHVLLSHGIPPRIIGEPCSPNGQRSESVDG